MEVIYLITVVFVAVVAIRLGIMRPDIVGVLLLIAGLFYFHEYFSTDYFVTSLILLVIMGLLPFAAKLRKSGKDGN